MEILLSEAENIKTIKDAEGLLFSHFNKTLNILKALEFAKKAHLNQYRKSGEPYVVHPIVVGAITAMVSKDETMIISALLHDVVEDTRHSIEEIEKIFGKDVSFLVEGLTKIEVIRDEELIPSSSNQKLISSALTFRKMLISSIKDIRILVVKLCDRLHNMTTLDALPPHKQQRIAEETMVVYAPIAHRLGISQLKNRLEDLSFYYIYPDAYSQIDNYINKNRQNLQLKLNTFVQKIKDLMAQSEFKDVKFEVFGRVKHYYSIYQKMQRKGIGIDEVLDLIAIRILVPNPIDCYKALGLIHINFKPIISRFKDYITLPKDNGYSTIHTTIFDDEGIVEAQIRTFDMHKTAEFGIAGHWKYKDGGLGKNSINLDWLESFQYQNESLEEFYALAKSDLFSDDISVFSPAGDHYTLPRDSVALDFAYTIHSDIGNSAVEAIINKQRVSLLTTLRNGDIVKIITDNDIHVHCSWINSVKTSRAKEGLRSACKQKIKECNRLSAINIFSLLLNRDSKELNRIFNSYKLEDIIFKITINRHIYYQVLNSFIEKNLITEESFEYPKEFVKEHFNIISNRHIKNIDFDYCCHPKIGDEIVAFYDNEEITIHHKLCKVAYEKIRQHEPMVFISWVNENIARYQLILKLQNKKGILAEVLHKLALMDLNILSIELGIKSSESAEFCKLEVETKEQNRKKLKEKLSKKFKLVDLISLNDAYTK